MIWQRSYTLEEINSWSDNSMLSHLGIVMLSISDDTIEATMPVDQRTMQPFGLLHGGASVVLAESLGSIAGYLCTQDNQKVVGTEINASHIRPVSSGKVRGVCSAIHLGRRQKVWSIKIFDEQLRLSCICRLTTVII
ncbi:hotdog fold thioesterase [Arsenophonus endosymbiont of Aphis craccivora]|uniref:hotdog fold thioesterase n=1 Tax=Arsenophonus endosymbiont of Aphis craccivora TaxID=1231049 RepID=UPI0015DC8269|nr:hotdog fold thioesterase [Arsenophonus endosymbiont of Aphis craccivora]QLK88248.1 hotdog fold thioesterase [Arsenophonus endosymbiont of Aphis craccivora]